MLVYQRVQAQNAARNLDVTFVAGKAFAFVSLEWRRWGFLGY